MLRIGRITALLACLVALASGCTRPALTRDETVEALRAEVRRLQDEVRTAEARAADTAAAPAAKPAEDPFQALAVRFGTYTGVPASSPDRLKVVLEPLDREGDVVKRAGRLVLKTLAAGADGAAAEPYHTWTFPQEDLAETWIGTLGIRAYVLKLPWPGGQPPATEALLLRAAFTTVDGRTLETETRVPLGGAKP